MSNELAVSTPTGAALYRASTDAAGLCKELVMRTAKPIQGKKYVCVEGWEAIAVAHGCVASGGSVEKVEGGFRAIGRVRRMNDGMVIAEAEGFVGDDEKTWANRPVYARRAMAQTRAISRACRSAFAHVVVMMDAKLETTPAEEVPDEGFRPVKAEVKPVAKPVPPPVKKLDLCRNDDEVPAPLPPNEQKALDDLAKHLLDDVPENEREGVEPLNDTFNDVPPPPAPATPGLEVKVGFVASGEPRKTKQGKEYWVIALQDGFKANCFHASAIKVLKVAKSENKAVSLEIKNTGKYTNIESATLVEG